MKRARNPGPVPVVDWMHMDEKQHGLAALITKRTGWSWLFAALLLGVGPSACSSDEAPATKPAALGDCGGRAGPLAAGMIVTSEQGYAFELSQLEPSIPVQSDSPPGNHWTVTITDPSGTKVTGATLAINTYMPDHMHPGYSATGVETSEASGIYDVIDLVFAMPTLYSVSLQLALKGEKAPTQIASLMLCMEVASG